VCVCVYFPPFQFHSLYLYRSLLSCRQFLVCYTNHPPTMFVSRIASTTARIALRRNVRASARIMSTALKNVVKPTTAKRTLSTAVVARRIEYKSAAAAAVMRTVLPQCATVTQTRALSNTHEWVKPDSDRKCVELVLILCLVSCVSCILCLCASVPLCLCASVPLCLCASVPLCLCASVLLCLCCSHLPPSSLFLVLLLLSFYPLHSFFHVDSCPQPSK
jgi:hypothetical protein